MDYITQEDKTKIEEELNTRIRQRKELSDRIGRARELGDLKENGEYHAAREDQGMNEARIKQLEERLSTAIVADATETPEDMVFIGATVKLKDVKTGAEQVYRLVGEMSGDFNPECIEVTPTSALGTALMKARVGETVRADLPRGEKRFEIVELL
ncbi:MAG: transcription elongation factor GreA [Phycisphaerae bacterium]|nr:transcription elongation factor GreA [Phycisphaerae bacterium]|tara:strand:+ start:362 stop:826 length:465 start_codon:yes stop_codon:yes gene_type:complete